MSDWPPLSRERRWVTLKSTLDYRFGTSVLLYIVQTTTGTEVLWLGLFWWNTRPSTELSFSHLLVLSSPRCIHRWFQVGGLVWAQAPGEGLPSSPQLTRCKTSLHSFPFLPVRGCGPWLNYSSAHAAFYIWPFASTTIFFSLTPCNYQPWASS